MTLRPFAPAVLAAALLAACGTHDSLPPQPVVPLVPAAAGRIAAATPEQIAAVTGQPAWLNQRMPAGAIGYLRVPALWGMLGGTTGHLTRPMVNNAASIEGLTLLRDAFSKDALMQRLGGGTLQWLLEQDSPLEIVALAPNAQNGMRPEFVASVQTRLRSAAELNPVLASVFAEKGLSLDERGHAHVTFGHDTVITLHLYFDAATARLWLGGGGALDGARLERLAQDSVSATPNAALSAVEGRLDPNGAGMLLWADLVSYRMLLNALPSELRPLQPLLAQANAIGLASGSNAHSGTLALHVLFDTTPWPGPAPVARYDFAASGTPRWVWTMMLPTAAEIDTLLTGLKNSSLQGSDADYDPAALSAALREASGLDLAGWLAPFGRETLSLRDEAGLYGALRIRDRKALQTLLDTLVARFGATQRSHTYHGRTLHQLVLPIRTDRGVDLQRQLAELGMPRLQAFYELTDRIHYTLYWYEEEGWLLLAEVPQPLMARIDGAGPRQSVHDWLLASQGDDRSRALTSLSTELRDMPGFIYQLYLGGLAMLADMSKAPLDLFRLPTAQQLGLPEFSGLGAQIQVDERSLTFEMNYQHSALEPLFASSSGLVALFALGMTASVAVPAYQEYVARSTQPENPEGPEAPESPEALLTPEDCVRPPIADGSAGAQLFDLSGASPVVAAALTAAAPLQTCIMLQHALSGGLPDADAVADSWPVPFGDGAGQIRYEDGALILEFQHTGTPQLDGTHLVLMPEQGALLGALVWACGDAWYGSPHDPLLATVSTGTLSTVPPELLPAACKPKP